MSKQEFFWAYFENFLCAGLLEKPGGKSSKPAPRTTAPRCPGEIQTTTKLLLKKDNDYCLQTNGKDKRQTITRLFRERLEQPPKKFSSGTSECGDMSTGQDQYYDKGKDIFNIRGQSQGIYVLKLNVLDLCVFETSLAMQSNARTGNDLLRC